MNRIEHHGSESLSYIGPIICNSVPRELKQEYCLKNFQESIKLWKPLYCHSGCVRLT